MNGNLFMEELGRQVEAVKALGNTCCAWGCTYHMYCKASSDLADFIKRNKMNLILCLDVYCNHNWISTDDRANEFLNLFMVGDYDEALSMISYNKCWKYRRELEHVEFTIERG